jgi:NADH:ubiquinone oxidoreductase subunit 2 (subunit N)
VLDEVGVAALLFNLLVQLFAVCGVYYVISLLVDELGTDRLEKLRGAVSCTVLESIVFILFLACIVGLPPLPGFIGKFALIGAAVRHEWYPLAILAILSMILGVAAIARIAYSLLGSVHLGSNHSSTLTLTRSVHLAVLVVPLIIMAVFAEFFLSWAGQSLQFILW